MQNSKTLLPQGTREIPDYTCDYEAAKELAKKVQDFYHSRGYKKVRCWIEPIATIPQKVFGVRSNIVFDVSKIKV